MLTLTHIFARDPRNVRTAPRATIAALRRRKPCFSVSPVDGALPLSLSLSVSVLVPVSVFLSPSTLVVLGLLPFC